MLKLATTANGVSVKETPASTRVRTIHFLRVPGMKDADPGPATFPQTRTSTDASELYSEAFKYVTRTFVDLKAGRDIDLSEGHSIACQIVAHLSIENGILRLALDRTMPFSIQLHSLNVSIIAAKIARTLHWPEQRVQQVALAALVHDAGSVRIPTSLIFKSASSPEQDRMEKKQRPLQSAEMLSGQPGFEWLRKMVLQMHEREDGSGYPMGLRGRDICDEAKVLGVADIFEACIHPGSHRPALTGYAAMQIITSDAQGFPEQIRKAVIQSFSVYPYNEYVTLNTGEIAVVTDINPANSLRPIVSVLYSQHGILVAEPRTIDLVMHSQFWVHSALTAAELPQ
jgi:HD-GYP domain-containing protein (c-di-GMP phosphodiesterase class II)